MVYKKKWSKTCEAANKLEAMIDDGRISGNELPRDVWLMDKSFQDYDLTNFRSNYNKLKAKKAVHMSIIYIMLIY